MEQYAFYIGVLGGANPDNKHLSIAYDVGRLLAKKGCIVLCGGLDGVMKETARGVRDEHGVSIGILPGAGREEANGFLTYTLPTAIGYMRNFLIVRAAEALIAIDGSNGTISEESFAISEGRDVIGIDSLELKRTREREGNYIKAKDAEDAVDKVMVSAKKYRNRTMEKVSSHFDS